MHEVGDEVIVFPYYQRKVESYTDIVSPWYYGGPLYSSGVGYKDLREFYSSFETYCRQSDFVSAFLRYHPYLDNHNGTPDSYYTQPIGQTVWIDLQKSSDDILGGFSGSRRKRVRKGRASNLRITQDESGERIEEFHTIYIENMKAFHTRPFYFFNLDFLKGLFNSLPNRVFLLNADLHESYVGGSLFLQDNGRMYYYLSARNARISEGNSTSLILFQAAIIGKQKGLSTFDLGGGPLGSSLLEFKRSFTNNTRTLYASKMISSKSKYDALCKDRGIKPKYHKASFFPEYRATMGASNGMKENDTD